ncbi:MAG: hypothetical protein HZC55_20310 [Verrucomicrobia bacterium]|nr:hypothetical protein [Verrucomicrobiota bacterium]
MSLDWARIAPALLLLLPPVGLFHGRKVHLRALSRDWEGYWRRTFALPLHYLDLVRGAAGAWLLAAALTPAASAAAQVRHEALALKIALLALAALLQAAVCKERDSAHAPIAFLIGVVIGTAPPLASAFGLVIAVALPLGANSPAAFFPMLAITVPAAGSLFTGRSHLYELITVAVVAIVPWIFTLLFSRDFVSSYRASPKRSISGHVPDQLK